MRGLADRTALITGSGSGIGKAIAERLASEGATVAVNDIDREAAADTVAAIEEEGHSARTAPGDVTDLDKMRRVVETLIEEEGGVDILVNNAGWEQLGWFVEQDPDIWDRTIDINLKGQINCARAVAEHLTERDEGGTIVNVASDAARVGSSAEAVYSGAKGGVIAFTKTLARELARSGVTCNAVAPGPTDTPMSREIRETELGSKLFGNVESQTPLGRMAKPEDIANGVAFLASAEAEFITGQVLSISGGLTMVG